MLTMIAGMAPAVFGAASAQATVTSSSITSVSEPGTTFGNPFFYTYNKDLATQPQMTISGTTTTDDANASDKVTIMCFYGEAGSTDNDGTIASNVPVSTTDGSFTWTGDAPDEDWSCRLAAVPSSSVPSDPSLFSGPTLNASEELTKQDSSGNTYDYENDVSQTKIWNEFESVGDCGFDSAYTTGALPGYTYGEYSPWDCADALYGNDGSSRSEIQVDGRNAYDGYAADSSTPADVLYGGSEAASARADVTVTRTQDPATGNTTIVETENLVECQANPDPYPATQANCGGTKASGVRLTRTISTSADGQGVKISDEYSSVDGAQHPISLEYDNDSEDEYHGTVYQFPNTGSFQPYATGDEPALGNSSTGTIYVQGDEADSYLGGVYSTPGSMTYTTQPSAVKFISSDEFLLDYQRTVPASGSVTITHMFVTSNDLSTVQAMAQKAEDSVSTPSVSITSPRGGSTVTAPQVTVAGSASDIHGVSSLTVDGVATSVNPNGGWSATVPLKTGRNTITAVATNQAGVTAQAQETVVYSPPAGPVFCIVPNVAHDTVSKAKAALKKAHCRVGKVSKVKSKTVAKGRVIHASYGANLVLVKNAKVGLTQSSGKPAKKKSKKHAPRHSAARHRR
jgi:hypothetical protein